MWNAVVAVVVAVMGTVQDWDGVAFGRAQLEQVQQFAAERMLDPPVDGTPRLAVAWRHAAELALWNAAQPMDLLPVAHLAQLHAQGWRPPSPPETIACGKAELPELRLVPGVVAHGDAPGWKASWAAWHEAHGFGRAELYCVLEHLMRALPADELRPARQSLLWVNAASGWLKGLDKHSDVLAARYWDRVSQPDQTAPQADLGLAVTPCTAAVDGPAAPAACCVADVREGSSAWQAKLRLGDRLETPGFDPCAQPELLRGEAGSVQVLRVRPVLGGKPRSLRLRRDFAVIHDVTAARLERGVLHVRLGDFVKGTASRVRAVLASGGKPKDRPRAVVLDLRDNTGGVLDEATAIADLLLSHGRLFTARWHGKPDEAPEAHDTPDDIRVPLVLLVNRMCASACEVLTGALQDHRRALVVGEHTLGKASMQRIAKPTLMAGFYVKATIGHYWTPLGRDLDGVGALPEIELPVQARAQLPEPAHPPWRQAVACVAREASAHAPRPADPAPRRKPDPWLAMAAQLAACLPAQPESRSAAGRATGPKTGTPPADALLTR